MARTSSRADEDQAQGLAAAPVAKNAPLREEDFELSSGDSNENETGHDDAEFPPTMQPTMLTTLQTMLTTLPMMLPTMPIMLPRVKTRSQNKKLFANVVNAVICVVK